ncbi:MAG: TIGR00269 family protein [Archaeoglobaceae archaeon]|nr:TIGR00269 family protein [Archaeoglobaceae archaeon]MCX8152583.1 TIGR00269 family protein [Archaeoglobaceae archaeon]MDW8014135.1 TIGR00269 family protein [Archaeoglobaceae archaeon]
MKCSKCERDAVYFQRHSNRPLCKRHFVEDFERRVKYSVNRFKMIERGDRIAIALSGGKDSTTLTFVLKKLYSQIKDLEFFAITVDEGIENYREKTVKVAEKICRELDLEHVVVKFKDYFGLTLDEIVKVGEKKPCTYCGVFRKYLLNKTARELGATKLATAHNLDDEAQTIMLNFINADVERLARLIPQRKQEGLVMRIKPFREIYEREIVVYGFLNDLPIIFDECPYSETPVRAPVRDFLYDFERKYPGRKFSILRSFEKILPALHSMYPQINLNKCERCSEPTPRKICQACNLLSEIMK